MTSMNTMTTAPQDESLRERDAGDTPPVIVGIPQMLRKFARAGACMISKSPDASGCDQPGDMGGRRSCPTPMSADLKSIEAVRSWPGM